MLTLNKRIFKKILILTICLIVFSLSFVSAVVNPTQEFYVNDYAGLLSKETNKKYITFFFNIPTKKYIAININALIIIRYLKPYFLPNFVAGILTMIFKKDVINKYNNT